LIVKSSIDLSNMYSDLLYPGSHTWPEWKIHQKSVAGTECINLQLMYSNLKVKFQTIFFKTIFFNLVDSKSKNLLDLV